MRAAVLALVALLVAAGCAAARPSPGAAPPEETVRLHFVEEADLARWRIAGGQWRIDRETALGTQVGDEYAYLTWPVFYGRIASVTIRGRIESPENRNLRVAVGGVTAIFNWELGDVNWYRNGWEQHDLGPHALSPGKDHEIRFTEDGGVVRIFVDGRETWETHAHLHGTVSVYPAVGSTIRLQEVEIRGVPVPWVAVDGPSDRAP
jgi:hypothetical protein